MEYPIPVKKQMDIGAPEPTPCPRMELQDLRFTFGSHILLSVSVRGPAIVRITQ